MAAVIAGGRGTRLFPISHEYRPNAKMADKLMRKGNTACITGINVWLVQDLLAVSEYYTGQM